MGNCNALILKASLASFTSLYKDPQCGERSLPRKPAGRIVTNPPKLTIDALTCRLSPSLSN